MPVSRPPDVRLAGHRRPNHVFRVVGVVLLAVGAVGGGYLGLSRPDRSVHGMMPVFDVAAMAPNPALDPAAVKAAASAKAKAAQAAAAAAAKARRANEVASREQAVSRSQPRTPQYPVPASCKAYSGNKALGCGLLLDAGYTLDEMPCLDLLWTRESHWNTKAENTSSGAYGIPQALPGDKMAAYGADWRTNPVPQIKWGLSYIKNRYGTPCNAWAHSQATGWY